MNPADVKLGVVLPAGGARAAYQVGVLRYLGEQFPNTPPRILTGLSAGSINACYLAQGRPFPEATQALHELWSTLTFDDVFKTNFRSLSRMFVRWIYDLSLGKVTHQHLLRSLLDASPLATTLLKHVHFWRISKAIHQGTIDGLAVSATNYHDGSTTVFYESAHDIPPWQREKRRAVRTAIRVRHIMASCSIPLLFEPVRIGDHLYGDGSLRFSFPMSPPIHLGATHLLAVGTRCQIPVNVVPNHSTQVGLGFVAGAVLNSIFLDSVEADYENLLRMNAMEAKGIKRVPAFLIRPTRDLGALAAAHIDELPFHFKQLLRSTASPGQLGDLMSYLMFNPPYLKELLALGYEDAKGSHDQIAHLLAE